MKAMTSHKKVPAPTVARAIQPSSGSNDKNPSPPAALKMQSINHISVAAPKMIVKISNLKAFLSLKKNHKRPAMIVQPKAVKKYMTILPLL